MEYGLLVQYEFCTGCHTCEIACKKHHDLPEGQWGITPPIVPGKCPMCGAQNHESALACGLCGALIPRPPGWGGDTEGGPAGVDAKTSGASASRDYS